ncbi:galactoside O-acetyltransferase [Photobacterium leiognathi subsp. mandapamensis]|uniref:sugar O-acetyltransferase n=1 Tax=Photobacterium leiognathi TaxID=553611 RepID=UPI000D16353F|nr:sugar O-acetyltransferase [Photobacterium leiognathi]PSW66418.1 galactoside O-acetyltransferase [Photobacterium leiognathi subsp. mandapamensis]
MDILEQVHSQKVYFCTDEVLANAQVQCLEVLYDFNQTRPSEYDKRQAIMKDLFATVGENCYIEPPLRANWGINTHIGNNVYANFNLTLVDDTHIYIGDSVMIGPNVTIATAGHPIDPDLRRDVAQFNIPVTIGNNVWLGAHVVVLPGVTIGENTVIGAGSIVTKDIPANVVAVGNPCRVLRPITEHDKEYYYKNRRIHE